MPVALAQIREILLPGLTDIHGRYDMIPRQWDAVFKREGALFVPKMPAIIIPEPSLPVALAIGAAAVMIKNPEVTRRFWRGWLQ